MLLSLFIIITTLQLLKTYNLARLKNYILSGIFIGLAIGTKYNAAILIVPFLITHLFICRNQKTGLFSINIIMGAISLFLTLFITNPFMFLDFKFFINSFAAQAGASGYVGWLHHINYSLRESIGLLFFILGLLGMLLITKENIQKGCLLFSFPIIFYLHLVFLSQRFPRYVIPLIPFFAIASAWFIFEYLIPKLKENLVKKFSAALIFLLFIPLIIKSIKVDILLSSKDIRIEAADWMKVHINSQSRIALDHTFFKPAIVQNQEQLKDKYESLDRQSGLANIKSKKLELMVQAQKQTSGYYLYFLSPYFAKPAQFLTEIPSLPFDLNILKNNNIDYVVINYAKRQKDTEKFYQALKDGANLLVSFSPYSDGKARFPYDMIATTALPLASKEIYSRIKNGPVLEIYELKK
jgi:4-amino-4-deoxy-L-arabinose transferase-like glycosyltransferase